MRVHGACALYDSVGADVGDGVDGCPCLLCVQELCTVAQERLLRCLVWRINGQVRERAFAKWQDLDWDPIVSTLGPWLACMGSRTRTMAIITMSMQKCVRRWIRGGGGAGDWLHGWWKRRSVSWVEKNKATGPQHDAEQAWKLTRRRNERVCWVPEMKESAMTARRDGIDLAGSWQLAKADELAGWISACFGRLNVLPDESWRQLAGQGSCQNRAGCRGIQGGIAFGGTGLSCGGSGGGWDGMPIWRGRGIPHGDGCSWQDGIVKRGGLAATGERQGRQGSRPLNGSQQMSVVGMVL